MPQRQTVLFKLFCVNLNDFAKHRAMYGTFLGGKQAPGPWCRAAPVMTSVMSYMKWRIKPFEFDASLVHGEAPIDASLDLVALRLPSGNLVT